MTPFYTEKNQADLEVAALYWEGTPFAPAAAVRGERGGVCCHRLVIGVLADAGFPVTQDEIPDGPLGRATHHKGSMMADWLREHGDRWKEYPPKEPVRPGDILLIRIGVGAHHAAIVLPDGKVCQSWQGIGAHVSPITANKLHTRIAHIFRPLA